MQTHDELLYRHRFSDRRDAGRQLARALQHLQGEPLLVLALPRGGVPVGFELASALHAPLDVLFVRKLGAPGQPELGIGAVVDGNPPQRVLNERVVSVLRPPESYIEEEAARQLRVIAERKRRLRHGQPAEPVAGRTVILVDDGIATGGTVKAALQALTQSGARRVILAVPVAPAGMAAQLALSSDDFVALLSPTQLTAVGMYYDDFSQISDEEVIALLEQARRRSEVEHGELCTPPPGAALRLGEGGQDHRKGAGP